MKRIYKYLLLIIFISILDVSYSQKQIIVFKYDTISIEGFDTIFYKYGNEIKGEVKYGSGGDYSIVYIDSGFRIKERHYYANGQINYIYNYKNGNLNGDYKEWNYTGNLKINGHYTNGYEDSLWTYYYDNGNKETEGSYILDTTKLIDNFEIKRFLHESNSDVGAVLVTRFNKKTPPDGEWKFYNKEGKLIKTLIFDKGVIKSIQVGDNIGEEY